MAQDWLKQAVRGRSPTTTTPVEESWIERAVGPKPKGFFTALSETADSPSRLVPFLGSAAEAYDAWELKAAAERMQSGMASDDDVARVEAFLRDAQRPTGWGYTFGSILSQLPAFAGEFAATGGAYRAGAAGAKAALGKVVGEAVEAGATAAAKRALLSVAGATAGTLAQTAAMPTRYVTEALRLSTPGMGLQRDEAGKAAIVLQNSTRGFLEALPEGFLDTWIESASERSGGLVRAVPPLAQVHWLQGKLLERFAGPSKLDDTLRKVAGATGWHGMFEEWGEERVGGALRALLMDDSWADVIPSLEQGTAELAAFAVPGAIGTAGRAIMGQRGGPVPAGDVPTPTQPAQEPGEATHTGAPLPQDAAGPAMGGTVAGVTPGVQPEMPEDATPSGQQAAADFVRANAESGATVRRVRRAETPEEQEEADLLAERGVDYLIAEGEGPLPLSGYHLEDAVVVDAASTPQQRRRHVVYHELTHVLQDVRQSTSDALYRDLAAADEDGLAAATARYAQDYAVRRGRPLDPELLMDEGLAAYVESIGSWIDATFSDREAVVRLATRDPGLLETIIDAVARLLARFTGREAPSRDQRELERLLVDMGRSDLTERLGGQRAAQIALRVRGAMDTLLGREPGEGFHVEQPTLEDSQGEDAAQPGGPAEPEPAGAPTSGGASPAGSPEGGGAPTSPEEAPAPKAPEDPYHGDPVQELGDPSMDRQPGDPAPSPPTVTDIPEGQVADEEAEARAGDKVPWETHAQADVLTRLRTFLRDAGRTTIKDARAWARGDAKGKELDELLELAAVLNAREDVARLTAEGWTPAAIFDHLVRSYERVPRLNERTSDSRRFQAYSTPLPLAYLVSRIAGVAGAQHVLEPTAGNGALLLEANPETTTAIELQEARAIALELQGFTVVRGDALEELDPGVVLADAIVANPPFGKVLDDNGKAKAFTKGLPFPVEKIDHAIALKALQRLKKGGRAVFVLGSPSKKADKAQRSKGYLTDRAFWRSLYQEFNVVEHFTVDGKLYDRQGAAWPIDVVVVEGPGASMLPLPMAEPPAIYKTWDELKERVSAERSVVPEQGGPEGGGGGVADVDSAPGAPGRLPPAADDEGGADDAAVGDAGGGGVAAGGAPQGKAGPRGTARGGRGQRGGRRGVPGDGPRGGEPVRPAGPVAGEAPERDGEGGGGGAEAGGSGEVAGGVREPLTDDELDALIESEIAGEAAAPEPEPTKGRLIPRRREDGSVEWTTEPVAEEPRQEGGDDWVEGLRGLFAVRPAGFEEERYEKATPFFESAAKAKGVDVTDETALVKAVVSHLKEQGFSVEQLRKVALYLREFVKDKRAAAARDLQVQRQVDTEIKGGQAVYTPSSAGTLLDTRVPANQADAVRAIFEKLRDEVGNLDDFVAGRMGWTVEDLHARLGAEQVDTVALAMRNIERGGSLVMGHQTGIGKGRAVGTLIQWARRLGKVPVFVTKDPALYADMIRDIGDTGGLPFNPWITNNGITDKNAIPLPSGGFLRTPKGAEHARVKEAVGGGQLPEEYDAIFTTYSQLNPKKSAHSERFNYLRGVMPNAFVILDESHLATGPAAGVKEKIDKATKLPLQSVAADMRTLLGSAWAAFYSSATWAKNPNNMSLYMRTDLGRAATAEELTYALKYGGVPMQQIVSTMLARTGNYFRLEKSFEGIEFKTSQVNVDTAQADRMGATMESIFEFDKAMKPVRKAVKKWLMSQGEMMGSDSGVGEASVYTGSFSSIMHNLMAQYFLAIKAEQAAQEAIEAHRRGEKPVLAVNYTMGSMLDEYVTQEKVGIGDAMPDLTFNRMVERYLGRTRRVTIQKDPKSPKKHLWIDDDLMAELGFPHMADHYNRVLEEVREADLSNLPSSPIDAMRKALDEAGLRVGEVTGRSLVVENDGRLGERDSSTNAKVRTVAAFNAGNLDALILNRSGGTGISMHSDKRFRDQSVRHMLFVGFENDINDFQQMTGRINRTGQQTPPVFTILLSNIPAEKRPAGILLRKLAGLNANVSSARGGAVNTEGAVDLFNHIGDRVMYDLLVEETWIQERLGYKFLGDPDSDDPSDLATKATGKVGILPVADQARIFDRLEVDYRAALEAAGATDTGAGLEIEPLDTDAEVLQTEEFLPARAPDTEFGQATTWELVDMKRLQMPMPLEEARQEIDPDYDHVAMTDEVQAAIDAHLERLRAAERESRAEGKKDSAALIHTRLENETTAGAQITTALASFRRGAPVRIAHVDRSTNAVNEDKPMGVGFIVNVERRGKAASATSPSDYIVSVISTIAPRVVKYPLSQVLRLSPRIELANTSEVEAEYEEAASGSAREKRWIVTGNLIAGINKVRGRPAYMRFKDGSVREALLMRGTFDPNKAANLPIGLTAGTAARFLEGTVGAVVEDSRTGASVVRSTVDFMAIVPSSSKGTARGASTRPLYVTDAVVQAVGQFTQRRGDENWTVTTDAAGVAALLRAWEAAGAKLQSKNNHDAAKQVVKDAAGRFAVRPSAEEIERIRGFAKKAQRRGERTTIGRKPNPIAGVSEDARVRAFQRGVREERAGGEEVQSRKSQEDFARVQLQADPDGVKASLLEKIEAGETLNAWETEAAKALFVEGAFNGLRKGASEEEYADAAELAWAYMDARRDQARALGQIRDPLKQSALTPGRDPNFTPRDRVGWLILQPSRDARRKLHRLRREFNKPTTTAGRRKQIREEMRKVRLEEARRMRVARERLDEAGLSPDLITDDYFDDPVLWARIARIVSTSKSGKWDWYIEYQLAAMLSGPLTHKANFVGNVAHAVWEQHLKRLAEAMVNVVARDPNSATFGEEAYALYRGFLPGFFQGVHNFFMAYRTELPVYEVDLARKGVSVGEYGVKVDALQGPAIPGKIGQILRAPSLTTLLAFDELVKTWVGVMEANALAYREARKEGLKGDAAAARIEEILNDYTHPVHGQALLKSKVVAFQNEKGPLTKLAMQARAVGDELIPGGFPLGTQLLPFVQTPAGIFRVGLESVFQPFRALFRLARGRYRGNKEEAVRDMGHALLSMAVWGAVMAMVFGEDDEGLPLITGSGSSRFDERALQWRTAPPYSIKVLGEYRDYRRVEPAAVTFATLVDIGLAAKTAMQRGDQDGASEAMGRLLSSIGDQMKDKTFLRTVGEVYEALFNRERNEKLAPRLLRDVLFTKMVPNIVKQPLRQTDPYVRSSGLRKTEDAGIWEAAARSTGFEVAPSGARADAPPPRYDLWGRPLRRFSDEWSPVGRFVYDLLSPVPKRGTDDVSDLDLLLLRYNDRVARGEFEDARPFYGRPPDYYFRKDGKTHYWSEAEYAELTERSGQMAAQRLMRAGLDFENPTPEDVGRIADELARARRIVRSSMQSRHFKDEPK